MKALLLRLAGPMQAWGTQSRFVERDTQLEPSKSGVVGILAAALGRRRGEDLADLAALAMGVRVDREGKKLVDYHTAGGGKAPREFLARHGAKYYGVSQANSGEASSNPNFQTVVTRREYLADARFLVALAGEEGLLLGIAEALRAPVFPLFLGRKSFVPTSPILYDFRSPLREGDTLKDILVAEPWEPEAHDLQWDPKTRTRSPKINQLRLVLEADTRNLDNAASRPDQPISFERSRREFRERLVLTDFNPEPITRWRAAQATPAERTSAA